MARSRFEAVWQRGLCIGLSLLLHAALLQAVLSAKPHRRTEPTPPPVEVFLITLPKPPSAVVAPEPPKLVSKPKPAEITPPKRVQLVTAKAAVTAADNATAPVPVQAVAAIQAEAPARPQPPAPAPEIHRPAQVDASATCRAPPYPAASRRAREAGTVRLLFLIAEDGQVIESRVESSSGSERLDEAARDSLSLCHFTPGTVDGRPERSWARIDYVWKFK